MKRSILRSSVSRSQILLKDIEMHFENFAEIVEEFNVGDCISGHQLSLKKLFHKLEKVCNFFFKGCKK